MTRRTHVSNQTLQVNVKVMLRHCVHNIVPSEPLIVEILHTDSTFDIVWQDGTYESGVSSTELFESFWVWSPGIIVTRNDSSDDSNVYGIIQSVDPNGKVARVKWWEMYKADHIEQRPRVVEEADVSLYDIKRHPDFGFHIGSAVICQNYNALTSYYPGVVKDIFADGQILVWWANKAVTACWPQNLFLTCSEDGDYNDVAEIDDWDEDEFMYPDWGGESYTLPTVLNETESENQATMESEINETGDFNPSNSITNGGNGQFVVLENVPDTHHYYPVWSTLALETKTSNTGFLKAVRREISLLRELPPGIFVKGYEDRMDLFSVMILGPEKTPYEDGLFLFDIKLPLVHYVSFASERLNPNLYKGGKVCLSLLGMGTWEGKQSERWTTSSALWQVLISIQGLILVTE